LLDLGIEFIANVQQASSQPPVFTISYGGFSHFQDLHAF